MILRTGRLTRRTAIGAAALMTVASPAFASLVIDNFMEANVSVSDACFVKVAGDDATTYTGTDADDPQVLFDDEDNRLTVDGVDLLEEQLSIRGMRGDRVYYTDIVRYRNDCDVTLQIQLTGASVTDAGQWTDRSARVYLSDTVWTGEGAEPAFGVPGDPGSGWNDTPIVVAVNGSVTSSETGTVTVPPGSQIRGAIAILADAEADDAASVLNWTAVATHAN